MSGKTNKQSGFAIRGIFAAAISFLLCLMIMPLILMKTDNPGAFAGAGSAVCISAAALFGSYFFTKGSERPALVSFLISTAFFVAILLVTSLAFGGAEEQSGMFSKVILGLCAAFCAIGVYLAKRSKSKRKKGQKRKRSL